VARQSQGEEQVAPGNLVHEPMLASAANALTTDRWRRYRPRQQLSRRRKERAR
jgi:hypothetical protein